jgi:hypothetical protein
MKRVSYMERDVKKADERKKPLWKEQQGKLRWMGALIRGVFTGLVENPIIINPKTEVFYVL